MITALKIIYATAAELTWSDFTCEPVLMRRFQTVVTKPGRCELNSSSYFCAYIAMFSQICAFTCSINPGSSRSCNQHQHSIRLHFLTDGQMAHTDYVKLVFAPKLREFLSRYVNACVTIPTKCLKIANFLAYITNSS